VQEGNPDLIGIFLFKKNGNRKPLPEVNQSVGMIFSLI